MSLTHACVFYSTLRVTHAREGCRAAGVNSCCCLHPLLPTALAGPERPAWRTAAARDRRSCRSHGARCWDGAHLLALGTAQGLVGALCISAVAGTVREELPPAAGSVRASSLPLGPQNVGLCLALPCRATHQLPVCSRLIHGAGVVLSLCSVALLLCDGERWLLFRQREYPIPPLSFFRF